MGGTEGCCWFWFWFCCEVEEVLESWTEPDRENRRMLMKEGIVRKNRQGEGGDTRSMWQAGWESCEWMVEEEMRWLGGEVEVEVEVGKKSWWQVHARIWDAEVSRS